MKKRLVLLSDGTGNSSAKAEKTNVWRLFQALDPGDPAQLMMYHDGVGSSSNKYFAGFGGAFGWGLKRNVIEMYEFICRNYEAGDELFAFGFSRGAFTARTLIDLILHAGLIDYSSEADLRRNAERVYASYRESCFKPASGVWAVFSPVTWARALRGACGFVTTRLLGIAPPPVAYAPDQVTIRFLGLWDTVSAYGMPIEEFKPMVNFLFWPMFWNNRTLSPRVQRCCHALALDDQRTTFHPVVFDEREEARLATSTDPNEQVAPGRLSQVWFAGVHSNLGGGYPEDQLALESLDWMMSQAQHEGLVLLPDKVAQVQREKSYSARLYDSRSGFGALYRYSPRVIQTYSDSGPPIWPVLHYSVVLRMAFGADTYSPLSLPPHFQVLTPDGSILSPHADTSPAQQGNGLRQLLDQNGVADCQQQVQQALAMVGVQKQRAMNMALDTVWWRRLVYFCTLGSVGLLLALPWTGPLLQDAVFGARTNEWSGMTALLVGSALGAVNGLLPSYMAWWTSAFMGAPFAGLLMFAALLGSLYFNRLLHQRILDRCQLAWHDRLAGRYETWLRGHAIRVRRVSMAGLGAIGLSVAAGAVAQPASGPMTAATIFWVCVGLALACLALASLFQARAMLKQLNAPPPVLLPQTFSLEIARKLRGNRTLVWLYRRWSDRLVPAILGLGVLCGLFIIANHVVVAAMSASGTLCNSDDRRVTPLGRAVTVPLNARCGATGIRLERGNTYRITLTDRDGQLFDRTEHTDLGGFDGRSQAHRIGKPFRRWPNERWFTPIARVGQFGNEEYALHPAIAYAPVTPPYPVVPDTDYRCGPDNAACGRWAAPTNDQMKAWSAQRIPPPERRTLQTVIAPKGDGELFLYVNDAAMPLLPNYGWHFYENNAGAITVRVDLETNPPPVQSNLTQ